MKFFAVILNSFIKLNEKISLDQDSEMHFVRTKAEDVIADVKHSASFLDRPYYNKFSICEFEITDEELCYILCDAVDDGSFGITCKIINVISSES